MSFYDAGLSRFRRQDRGDMATVKIRGADLMDSRRRTINCTWNSGTSIRLISGVLAGQDCSRCLAMIVWSKRPMDR